MTWVQFISIFMNQFFPQTERDARREEFKHLVQGSLLVSQYESKFDDKSQYATDLVDTDEKKVRRFLCGLRPTTHTMLVVMKLTEYRDVVDRALIMKRGFIER